MTELKSPLFLLATLAVFSQPGVAISAEPLDPIVVTAERLGPDGTRPGDARIDPAHADSLGKSGWSGALLADLPGVTVSSAGGAGKSTSVMLRGAQPSHTLVLIDGIAMNDPTHPTRSFDFASLFGNSFETIEVARGPRGAEFGSDALGGALLLTTRKGHGPARGFLEGGLGSYGTSATRLAFSGEMPHGPAYSFGVGALGSQGFSAADAHQGNTEADGRSLLNAHLRLDLPVSENTDFTWTLRGQSARSDDDFSGGPGGDDPDARSEEAVLASRFQLAARGHPAWHPTLGLSVVRNLRRADNSPDAGNPFSLLERYRGTRLQAELRNELLLNDRQKLWLDGELRNDRAETLEFSRSQTDLGVALRHSLTAPAWSLTSGARADTSAQFGTALTYRVAPSFTLASSGTTFRAAIGSGFKAPALYQLFSSAVGNPALAPEKSLGADLGIEQELLSGQARVSLTFFQLALDDLIDFDFATYRYHNIGRARTRGLELSSARRWSGSWESTLNYTYLSARDEQTRLPLLRRPRHSLSTETVYRHTDRTGASLQLRALGARWDIDAITFGRKLMPGYAVAAISGFHHFLPDLKLTARIDNLFDRAYQEIDGYGTPGRSYFLSVQKGF